jgi:nucleoid-associated protein YgaU
MMGGFTVTVEPFGHEHHYGSLWDIADDVYGDGSLWIEIYDANRERIDSDANYVQVGRRIYVPAIPRQEINH